MFPITSLWAKEHAPFIQAISVKRESCSDQRGDGNSSDKTQCPAGVHITRTLPFLNKVCIIPLIDPKQLHAIQ